MVGSLGGYVIGCIVNYAVDIEETVLLIDIELEQDIAFGIRVIPGGVYECNTAFVESKTFISKEDVVIAVLGTGIFLMV